jgi:signal transduction histidine kinase
MPDHVSQGVRITTPAIQNEVAVEHHRFIPLSVKISLVFFIGLGIMIIPIVIFNTPAFASLSDKGIAVSVLSVVIVCMYAISMRLYVHPLHTLLDWIQTARAHNFERIPTVAIVSSDEIGHLAQEVSAVIALTWQLRRREQELLTHKSDTITLIEHQLRTALTSLKWSLESVEVPPEVRTAVLRINDTIQDIINAARIGEGTFGYVFADVDIIPLIESLISRSRSRAESRGVALSFEHEEHVPHIKADADRLAIAISNILSNAIEYTPSGGTVVVSVTKIDQSLDVSIKDTGIGMSQEDIANLFIKMHRGKTAMKMRPDGSGLGLYVARNILDEHHAEIMVRSEEGRGTQVSFRIGIKN